MNTDNLAIVFTPVVFRNENSLRNPKLFMEELPKCQKIMNLLIESYPYLISSDYENLDSLENESITVDIVKRKGSNFNEETNVPKLRHSLDGNLIDDNETESDISEFLPKKILLYSTRKPPKPPIKRLDHIRGRGKSLPLQPNPDLLIQPKRNRCANCHLKIDLDNEKSFKEIEYQQLYHHECFKCKICENQIQNEEEYNFSKNRITCMKCGPYESDELDLGICDICKSICSFDDSIFVLKKFYHEKECFRCSKCENNLKIENYETINGFPICKNCWNEK